MKYKKLLEACLDEKQVADWQEMCEEMANDELNEIMANPRQSSPPVPTCDALNRPLVNNGGGQWRKGRALLRQCVEVVILKEGLKKDLMQVQNGSRLRRYGDETVCTSAAQWCVDR